MTFIVSFILKLGLVGIAVGGVFMGHKYLYLKDDNVAEEVVEQVIKDEIGIAIDLTPNTAESSEQSSMVKEISSIVEKQTDRL